MPGAIFVSYRRATTSNAAGRLADRLMERFGEDQVFVDVDAIEPGVDFVEVIENAVAACRVLLVVIGPTWHSVADAAGRRRLDDPHDPVVIEVRAGLVDPTIRVIPVLVEGAQMPRMDDLPPDLRRLARINAARLEHASFRRDAARLVDVLVRALAAPPPSTDLPAVDAPAPAEELILDDFPAPTTSPELVEARELERGTSGEGSREQVTAAYRRATDSGHPDAPLAWAELGFFQAAEDLGLADESFGRAVASGHPTAAPIGDFGLALAAYVRGDLAEAENRLRPVVHSRSQVAGQLAAVYLAYVLARRHDFEGAREAYERAIELGEDEPSSTWIAELANELDAAGDTEGATALLRWFLAQPLDEPSAQAVRQRLVERDNPSRG